MKLKQSIIEKIEYYQKNNLKQPVKYWLGHRGVGIKSMYLIKNYGVVEENAELIGFIESYTIDYLFRMNNQKNQEWRGYPLRCWPNHQDDCYRWDWEVQIDGKWLEVVTQATRWIEDEAEETLQRYLERKKT